MSSEISALVDGELSGSEMDGVLDALARSGELRRRWAEYQLLGDVLRGYGVLSPGFDQEVAARLADEPTVLAPGMGARRPLLRAALPLAASIAGVAAVAWVAQSLNASAPQTAAAPVPATQAVAAAPDAAEQIRSYLVAHQGYASSNGIQGVALYVRSVSETDQARK
jgi:sigma-E factor negative regulatory protein RseA